jgi:hypothetical protein
MTPVERRGQLPNTVSLYQPVFYAFREMGVGEQFLASGWVRGHTADVKLGYGKLFLQKHGSTQIFPDEASLDWIPSRSWSTREIMGRLPRYVHQRIHHDLDKGVGLTSSKKCRKQLRIQVALTTRVDRAILRKARDAMMGTNKKTDSLVQTSRT